MASSDYVIQKLIPDKALHVTNGYTVLQGGSESVDKPFLYMCVT